MKSRLLRSQKLFQKINITLNYKTTPRLFCTTTTSTDSNIQNATDEPIQQTQPHLTAFKTQSSVKPSPPSTHKYEYPKPREKSLQKSFNYCIEELEREEPQINDTLQYLKVQSDHQRLAIVVLRVLHLELSRVRTTAATSDAARVRLNWWKSAIKEIIDEKDPLILPKESAPVLTALRVIRRRYNLNGVWLLKLITSREAFLSSNTFANMLDLEEYAENTQSLLLYLQMEIMNIAYSSSKQNHFKCASHIGVLMTISSVIRSIPHSVQNDFIALPDDIASDCDVWRFEHTVLEHKKSTLQLKHAVQKMCESAYQHLYSAKDLEKGMPDNIKSIFLCSLPAQRYLRQLEKCGFDVFHPSLFKPDMGLSWKMDLMKKSITRAF